MSMCLRIALDHNNFEAAKLLYDNGAKVKKSWVIRSIINEENERLSFFLECHRDFLEILNLIIGMSIELRDLQILNFVIEKVGLDEIDLLLNFSLSEKIFSTGDSEMIEFLSKVNIKMINGQI